MSAASDERKILAMCYREVLDLDQPKAIKKDRIYETFRPFWKRTLRSDEESDQLSKRIERAFNKLQLRGLISDLEVSQETIQFRLKIEGHDLGKFCNIPGGWIVAWIGPYKTATAAGSLTVFLGKLLWPWLQT